MASSPFLRHVLTLVTGTAVAQAVSFLMTMVLARVYSPHDMGMLATYTSVAGIVMAVAALRYDMAVMLPRRDTEALAVARLALWCIVVVSVTATVAAFPLRAVVARHWGQEVATWMPMVGLTTLLMAGIELAKYWFNRHSDYRVIAVNQAEQQIGLTGGQLLLGVAGLGGLPGLVIGHTLGQFYAFCNLGRQAPALRRRLPQDAPSLREVASRYRRCRGSSCSSLATRWLTSASSSWRGVCSTRRSSLSTGPSHACSSRSSPSSSQARCVRPCGA